MDKKYMLIDPCYIGDEELAIRYGSPVAVFNTGDGVFEFDGQNFTVDSGIIHVYEVSSSENLLLQGDLADNWFAEVAYLEKCPNQDDVKRAVENHFSENGW